MQVFGSSDFFIVGFTRYDGDGISGFHSDYAVIGEGMDTALESGVVSVFDSAEDKSLWCLHMCDCFSVRVIDDDIVVVDDQAVGGVDRGDNGDATSSQGFKDSHDQVMGDPGSCGVMDQHGYMVRTH